ncbi:hypothetical protein UlMin_015684 [Ulmus minor]
MTFQFSNTQQPPNTNFPAFSFKTNKTKEPSDSAHGLQSLPTNKDAHDQKEQKENCGRERLKRHREEVAGCVTIPDSWGKEELLKDWMDYSSFDTLLIPNGIRSAREALRRQATSHQRLRIRC